MRAIIVDDNPDDRSLVRHQVEALFGDIAITEVASPDQLDAAMDAGTPDLVVTDLDLRWGSGRDVFARVRAAFPECPIIMFTGSGDEMTAVELMKAGLDDYVVKSPRQLPRLRMSLRIAVEAAGNRSRLTQREAELSAALARQQLLVSELNHRVKNNLQTVTSLLDLRARGAAPETALTLHEIAGRMRALGHVQARLYAAGQYDRVDIGKALQEMAETLVAVRASGPVRLDLDIAEAVDLDVHQAMPLGLLCYELMLNALKHAWPAGQPGVLSLSVTGGDTVLIRIGDDGTGFDAGTTRVGLGTRLIKALAREARCEVRRTLSDGGGTMVELRISPIGRARG